jgi:large conductance mechanosensitive channel
MGFIKEFREFALKGNVLDLAVGVIIGGAFGGIVNSMIKDVIMPVVGMAGSVDFSNQFIALTASTQEKIDAKLAAGEPVTLEVARGLGPVLAWGNFVTIILNFLILAFCIFLVIKAFNIARKRFEAEKPAPPPPGPSAEEKLLGEIRDLLKARA